MDAPTNRQTSGTDESKGGTRDHMRTDPIELRSDGSLVAAAAGGDQAAWDELVDRYAQFVWDLARGCGLEPAVAAEVSVVTWYRCADHLEDLMAGLDLVEWLTKTVTREAGDVLLATAPAPAAVSGTILDDLVQRRVNAAAEPAV